MQDRSYNRDRCEENSEYAEYTIDKITITGRLKPEDVEKIDAEIESLKKRLEQLELERITGASTDVVD